MPQLLERDRADADASERSANRRPTRRPTRRPRLLAAILGIAILVPASMQLVDVLPHWGNPFKQQIVDRSPAPLLLALQDLSQYHAATGRFQVVVDVEHDTAHVPALISGERTTFLGIGSVDAMIDFTNVGPDRVTVSPDRRTVTIALPAPRLAPAVVDPAASRVVGRERGLVNRIAAVFQDNPTSEQEVYQLAQARLNEAANASDLLRRSQDNTRHMLTTLGRSLGFSDVTVTFETV